jgi:cell division protein FtsI/penicillin-binding protein 2
MYKEFTTKNDKGEIIRKPCRYVVLQRELELDFSENLKKELKENKFHGLIVEDAYRRSYPKGEMLANILGVTSMREDRFVPLMGLEKSMNQTMQSGESVEKFERSRDGKRISYGNMEGDPVKDGCNIYLTIREPIQAIMEEEMDKLVARVKPKAAYAIMVEPYTGDIMAVSQRPTYNPNDRAVLRDNPQAARNRIAEDCFEPGSVMKSFVIAMAMDWNIVSPNDIIDCTDGVWYYAKRRLRDTHRVGKVPVSEVIKQSSNIGTAKIALMMGKHRLAEVLRIFGFGQKTGVPFRPETSGQVRDVSKWDGLSVTRFCIGQGVNVSILQLARAYCILANGGYPINLRLVDRLDRNGITESYPYVRGECVFRRADTHQKIKNMLVTVPHPGGTGRQAQIPGYNVTGKTGTAEKFINGQYRKQYFASFCGFVPSNRPRFVLLVTVDEPSVGGHYGGSIAGPTFQTIASRTLQYLREPYEVPLEEWHEKMKKLQRIEHQKRVKEDERVRAVRAARAKRQ